MYLLLRWHRYEILLITDLLPKANNSAIQVSRIYKFEMKSKSNNNNKKQGRRMYVLLTICSPFSPLLGTHTPVLQHRRAQLRNRSPLVSQKILAPVPLPLRHANSKDLHKVQTGNTLNYNYFQRIPAMLIGVTLRIFQLKKHSALTVKSLYTESQFTIQETSL